MRTFFSICMYDEMSEMGREGREEGRTSYLGLSRCSLRSSGSHRHSKLMSSQLPSVVGVDVWADPRYAYFLWSASCRWRSLENSGKSNFLVCWPSLARSRLQHSKRKHKRRTILDLFLLLLPAREYEYGCSSKHPPSGVWSCGCDMCAFSLYNLRPVTY